MIKIGIYCRDTQIKKDIKKSLKEYFVEFNVDIDISDIRTKTALLRNLSDRFMVYNIILSCEDDRILYVKRNIADYVKDYSNLTFGWINMPLSNEKIDEIIYNNDYHGCPGGIYKLVNRKTIRAISHGDIEFCCGNGAKTVIFLKDGEEEEVSISTRKLKTQLPEAYLAECIKGYIVNFYNVKKIDRTNHEFVMNSGHKIPISRNKFADTVRMFIEVMFGV